MAKIALGYVSGRVWGESYDKPVYNNHIQLFLLYSLRMNPDHLWLTGAMQLLAFFVIGPVLALAIAYRAWRGRPQNRSGWQYEKLCVASGVAAVLLFVCAKRIDADVRETRYFYQLACMVLSGLLFGACMGCGFSAFLHLWRWHKATRLGDDNQTER